MKDDKVRRASKRQRRQAERLGVKLDEHETIHSACQKLNRPAQAEAAVKWAQRILKDKTEGPSRGVISS